MATAAQWDPTAFQKRVNALLDRRSWSQNRLAEELGVSQTAVNRWMQPVDKIGTGRVTRPTPDALEGLSELGAGSLEELYRMCGYPWGQSQRGKQATPEIASLAALMQDAYEATPDENLRKIGLNAITALVQSVWNVHPRRRSGRPRSIRPETNDATEGTIRSLSYA